MFQYVFKYLILKNISSVTADNLQVHYRLQNKQVGLWISILGQSGKLPQQIDQALEQGIIATYNTIKGNSEDYLVSIIDQIIAHKQQD